MQANYVPAMVKSIMNFPFDSFELHSYSIFADEFSWLVVIINVPVSVIYPFGISGEHV